MKSMFEEGEDLCFLDWFDNSGVIKPAYEKKEEEMNIQLTSKLSTEGCCSVEGCFI
jgi:hypothetical protein